MQCTIVKPGTECTFMKQHGCGFGAAPSETCQPVVAQCDGCDNVQEWPTGKYCSMYAAPAIKWTVGICNMASHVQVEKKTTDKKLNPLKASKRGGH